MLGTLTDLPVGECVCGRPLPAAAVSDWACSEPCQSAWLHHALDPTNYPSPREIRASADRAIARRHASERLPEDDQAREERRRTFQRERLGVWSARWVDFRVRLFGGPMDGEVVNLSAESRDERWWPDELMAHVPLPHTEWVRHWNAATLEPRESRVVVYRKVLLRVQPDHYSPVISGAVYAFPGTAEVVWRGDVVDIADYWQRRYG